MNDELLYAALACIKAGVSIIPIDHATKRPATRLLPKAEGKPTWKPFQSAIADEVTVRRWFKAGIQSFAVVGGKVSGGLLVLDFDAPGFCERWADAVGSLANGLPVQQTGGGGYQVLLRCPDPGGNDKLAWTPDEQETTGRTIAIETRGEGGYAVVAPSVHPSGNHYKWLAGDAACVPTVTQDHADKLLAAARALDEAPLTRQEKERLETQARETHRKRQSQRNGQASVIDAFNQAHAVEALLDRHDYAKGTHGRYIRPGGKSESVSVQDGRSCHWSSDDPLNDGRGKGGCGCHDAFDLYAYYEHGGDVSKAVKAAAELLGMKPARNAQPKLAAATPSIEPYTPFPVNALPGAAAAFVDEGAKALGCDPAYIAMPLLAELASAIGNSRRIRLKASWSEPPVLWTVVVGDSGTLKSPAFDLALNPIRSRQKRAMKEYKQAQAEYLNAKEQYDEALKAWRKAKPADRGERPEEPEAPVCERLWCSDTTVEALADRLSNAPRGLLVARDELAGWLASFNQYKAGQGGDVAHWLEMHRAGNLLVDRKTGDKTTIFVPRAAVCIAGGIQPETLRRCLTPEFYDNGLAARLLLASPPRRVKQWTEADIDGNTLDAMCKLFTELLSFQPSTDIDGDPEPADIEMTDAAKAIWVAFYNQHAREQAELGGELSAAWSKLEGYAARLALVVHCVRQASGEAVDAWRCDETSMASGIALAKWFGHEAKRVYGVLCESPEDRDCRRLVELLQAKGGKATVRELSRASRLHASAADWEQALEKLVEAGKGRWQNPKPGAAGGHPVRRFHLLTQPDAEAGVDSLTVDRTPDDDIASGGSVNCQHVNSGSNRSTVGVIAGREQERPVR
jgi:hypothetical protein